MKPINAHSIHLALPLAFALALSVGCSDKSDVPLASVHVKTQLVTAANGAVIELTAADHPRLAKTKLVIPAGALARDTTITIGFGIDAIFDDGAAIGPAVELGPDGTQFSKPVELVIPLEAAVDKDLLRVYVRQPSGAQEVVLPYELTYDAAASTARLNVRHFTVYQGGRASSACQHVACPSGTCQNGQCNTPCGPVECGPAPGTPSWICEDGTPGGNIGECRRAADGTCGWVIINCQPACSDSECGPAPGAPNFICPDGTIGGPDCRRAANGSCGWEFVQCPPTGCGPGTVCPDGSICDPATNSCAPTSSACGANTCGQGEYCCNESCGTCAPLGATCSEQACNGTCANGATCPAGYSCDPATAQCVQDPTPCGSNTCGSGQTCCNPSCGICADPGETCHGATCIDCNGVTCPPGSTCDTNPNGTSACVSNPCDPATDCGPAPGIPNWICEDGSVGGPTGNCLRTASGQCGWEINWCPMACSDAECGPPPGGGTTCPDGTVAGMVCRHDPAGACGWVPEPCP